MHLFHGTDDRFFHKINKNMPCAYGPKLYNKSDDCLKISEMWTMPLKIPEIPRGKSDGAEIPGEKFSIIWVQLARKMLFHSPQEISGNANRNFWSNESAQKSILHTAFVTHPNPLLVEWKKLCPFCTRYNRPKSLILIHSSLATSTLCAFRRPWTTFWNPNHNKHIIEM